MMNAIVDERLMVIEADKCCNLQVAFYSTVGVTLFVAFILLLGILFYARHKRLLFISYSV